MYVNNVQVASKYASAFLNLFINKIDEKSFLNIVTAFEFIQANSNFISFFSLPSLKVSDKNEFIEKFLIKFDLILDFQKLMDILIKQNRLFLLKDILREIILLYQYKTEIFLFDISSAHSLDAVQLKEIKYFIERKTRKKVIESYKIDKSLIAGLKIKSHGLLWQYSINNKLQKIKQQILVDIK